MTEQQQRERERFERFFGFGVGVVAGICGVLGFNALWFDGNPWGLGFLAFACYFGSAVLRPCAWHAPVRRSRPVAEHHASRPVWSLIGPPGSGHAH